MNKQELINRIELAKIQLKNARAMRLPSYHIAAIKGYKTDFEAQLVALEAVAA